MKALFDFRCVEGHITERYIDASIVHVTCPDCGTEAHKILIAPSFFKIDGFRSEINGDEWARRREKNAKRTRERDGE